jgi:hypothetical protein
MSLGGQLIGSYSHLPEMPRSEHALTTLRRLASLVKPVMINHSFKVAELVEFYPAETNLLGLNVNHGQRICIRLRAHYDTSTFLPEDQIVGTMLHELTHNLFGPHDQKFYDFLHKLEEEYAAIRARGWNGEGFYSDGRRLGGRELPIGDARIRAARAAQQRAIRAQGSGQKLGGAIAPRSRRTLREKVAEAAERRARDAKTCGAGRNGQLAEESVKRGFATKAEEDDANEMAILKAQMELIEQDERRQWREDTDGTVWIEDDERGASIAAGGGSASADGRWSCPVCTLINPSTFLVCDACLAERPGPSQKQKQPVKQTPSPKKPFLSKASQSILQAPETKRVPKLWKCHMCRQENEEMWWTCTNCATMKLSS